MMERVESKIEKDCAIAMKYGNVPRPKTPPWLQKTVFKRHKSEFLIGGGIGLSLLIVTGIVLASTLTKQGNVDVEATTKEETREQQKVSTDPNDDDSFFPSVECENFDELVREWAGPEIILKNFFREQFGAIIENRERKDEDKTMMEMRSFYEFCVDEESIKKYGLESMKGVMKRTGGCRVVNNLREHFISAEVVPCPSIKVYCIQLGLDFKMESQERCEQIRRSVSESVGFVESVLCKDDIDVCTGGTDCFHSPDSLGNYCEWLATSSVTDFKNRSMTIDEYEQLYETNHGEELIRNTIPEGVEITNQTMVYFQDPISESLNFSHEMSSKDRLEVVKWKFVNSIEFFLPQILRNHFAVNFKKLRQRDRRKGCVNEILSAYPSSSLAMYKTEYYNSEIQENVERIFNDVKTAFKHQINWMDQRTRDELNAISLYTPKPKRDIFGSLPINETDPVQTVLNLKNLKFVRDFSYLNEGFNLEDEEFFKLDKNEPSPQYMAGLNQLYIPMETLHMYFEKGRPDYMNYVALGYMIARQIARGFQHKWFEENKQYSQNIHCFVEQFSDRRKHQAKEEVLNKIIPDYLGLRAAYAAYDISIVRSGNPQSNHSTYNNHQMFWMNAGKLFSNKDTIKSKLISNLNEFHRDFHCRIGSNMYPNQTCSLY